MTIELFKKSGWKISTSSRSYFPSIDDETLRVSLARPQEMSRYVESGTLDAGITGKDWTQENDSDVHVVCEMVVPRPAGRRDGYWPCRKFPRQENRRSARQKNFYGNGQFHQALLCRTTDPVEVEFSWGCNGIQEPLRASGRHRQVTKPARQFGRMA
jgi:ATP phosphoribosyltransferase